jgi:tetratricopeptide (TPR) repeat protein
MLISGFDPRAVIFLAIFSFLSPIGKTQQQSSEDAIREAGKLGTEAERIRGEAYKQVQAGGDRKLLQEAERAAAKKFRGAIELWRSAGDYDRLYKGAEELSRIYSVLNEYDQAVSCLRQEFEFWGARGDIARQVRTIILIGIRQQQMRRNEEAAKTLEEAVAMSRTANLITDEYNALSILASALDRLGRSDEAEAMRVRANGLTAQMYSGSLEEKKETKPPEAVKIPAQWIDLPSAPLVAEYRDVEGVTQAVLVNRSTKGIEMVNFGCIEEKDGKVHVVGELIGMTRNHGGVGPGYFYEPFAILNGPLNRWTNEKIGCGEKAKMTVIKAIYNDRTVWEAEGKDWISQ